MYHSETNTFHNVRKSKIKITDLYQSIQHLHECLVNIVNQYCHTSTLYKTAQPLGMHYYHYVSPSVVSS